MTAVIAVVAGLLLGAGGIAIGEGWYWLVDKYEWRGWYIDDMEATNGREPGR